MTTADAASVTPAARIPLGASLVALTAGTVWSIGALNAKLADGSDAWQYLVWRSLGVIVVMELVNQRRREGLLVSRAFTSGRVMVVACVAMTVASVSFIYALKSTTAANAVLLASITPLIAVVLARLFLGERLTVVTLVAIAVAFGGLLVMVSADTSADGGGGSTLGNLAALCSALGFATYAVCIRSSPHRDWMPVLPGYAILTATLCAVVTVAGGNTLLPPVDDVLLALVHGGVFIVVGTTLFNLATRHVPATAMAVFAQTETVFAPLWVFIGVGERPDARTLLGGAVILVAVVGKAVLDQPRSPIVDPLTG